MLSIFVMYLDILLSFLIVFRRKKIIIIQIILSVLFLILFIGNIFYFKDLKQFVFNLNSKWVLEFGAFFIAGSLLAAIKIEKFNRKNELLVLTFLLIIAAIYFDFYNYLKYIAVPILLVLFGLNPIPFIYNIGNRIGDLSYGIYIYGFPIQQTLMYYFKLNYLELMIYSLMISFIFAYFSWHYIEKRSLKLKTLHLTQVMRLAKIRVNKIKTVCVRN